MSTLIALPDLGPDGEGDLRYRARVTRLVADVRALLDDREQLAELIRMNGRKSESMYGPGGPRLLTRWQRGRLSWLTVHTADVWYVYSWERGAEAESWSVPRTPELDERVIGLIGRLAILRSEAWLLDVGWPGVVRAAAVDLSRSCDENSTPGGSRWPPSSI